MFCAVGFPAGAVAAAGGGAQARCRKDFSTFLAFFAARFSSKVFNAFFFAFFF
jgi:hypothetical protein